MADKLIRYITEIKNSQRVINEFKKLKTAGIGLSTANQKVARTSKLTDNTMLRVSGTFDKTGRKLRGLRSEVIKTRSDFAKSHPILSQYQKALMRVLIVVPLWGALRAIISGVTRAIRAGLTAYKEFEKEMGRVATVTLATGATLAEFILLKKAAIDYAQRTTVSLKDTATAMYQLATAGISAKDTIQGFSSVLDLSIGTMNSVEQTGKLVAGAFRLFGDEIGYAGTTADKFRLISDTLAHTFATQ